MKKTLVLILAVFFILPTIAAINLKVEKQSSNEVMILDLYEPAIFDLKKMLMSDEIPPVGISFGGGPCEYCTYREGAGKILQELHAKNKPRRETVGVPTRASGKK